MTCFFLYKYKCVKDGIVYTMCKHNTRTKNRSRLRLASSKTGAGDPNAIIIRTICPSWITNPKIPEGSFAFATDKLKSTVPQGFLEAVYWIDQG